MEVNEQKKQIVLQKKQIRNWQSPLYDAYLGDAADKILMGLMYFCSIGIIRESLSSENG